MHRQKRWGSSPACPPKLTRVREAGRGAGDAAWRDLQDGPRGREAGRGAGDAARRDLQDGPRRREAGGLASSAALWGCCPGPLQKRAPGPTLGPGPSRRRGARRPGNARACPAPLHQRDSHARVLPDPRMSHKTPRAPRWGPDGPEHTARSLPETCAPRRRTLTVAAPRPQL